jgi:hypothetical protein
MLPRLLSLVTPPVDHGDLACTSRIARVSLALDRVQIVIGLPTAAPHFCLGLMLACRKRLRGHPGTNKFYPRSLRLASYWIPCWW